MTRRILHTALLLFCFASASLAQTARKAAVHVGVIYPVSSNGLLANEYTNNFSFHLIAGVSAGERGAAISGFANVIRDSAAGAQFAGFANYIGGHARSTQVAGFMNYTRGTVRGAQLAGFTNMAGSVQGLQIAGFMNTVRSNSDVQIGGFMNAAKQTKVQGAGFINMAKKAHTQLAGFINIAEEVKGTQVAGFINVAKRVNGAQIGFINIADSSDCPIGVINLVKNGEKAFGVTVDETLTSLATFRSGGRRLYGILGAGVNLQERKRDEDPLYALETGIGLHVPITKHFRINAEGVLLTLTDFEQGSYLKSSVRVLPAVRFGHFEIFAGPSFNCVNITRNTGHDLVTDYTWEDKNRHGDFTGLYFGGIAGVQFVL